MLLIPHPPGQELGLGGGRLYVVGCMWWEQLFLSFVGR